MRLRKGYGSVRKLTGNRRNTYAVHPPKVDGKRPKALCYVNDYQIGICVLNAWHNGAFYPGLELDLKERKLDDLFVGGVKTDAGKNRIVPIHFSILPLVTGMSGVYLCGKSESQFRRDMKRILEKIGLKTVTPHSCRHTFHRLLERAGVAEPDRKRLMGHSLKGDITNGTYGHRGVEELRECVERIEVLDIVETVA